MTRRPEVAHSRDNAIEFFTAYVKEHAIALRGKAVVDLSTGRGYIAHLFEEAGANVQLFDLFPDQNQFANGSCQFIDLRKDFPIKDSSCDVVLLGETIEHLPDQYHFFQEASRILKPGGVLILTTPNSSSLRSRFSQFIQESEHYSMPAPNETNAYTTWEGKQDGYFSKIFISGLLRLRTLAALNGLSIQKIHPSPRSSTSYLLMIFFPIIWWYSRKALRRQQKTNPENTPVYREIFRLNTSPDILLSKHLIVEWMKQPE